MKFIDTVLDKIKSLKKAEAVEAVAEEATAEKHEPIPAKVPQPVATKKRKKSDLATRKANKGWFFVLPFVIGILAIYLPIVIDSICFSFSEIGYVTVDGEIVQKVNSVGFKLYEDALLGGTAVVTSLWEGVQQLVINVPAIVVFSLFIAVILNQKMIGRAFFRAVFFIPVILATGMMQTIDAMDVLSDSLEGGIGAMGGTGTGVGTGSGAGAGASGEETDYENFIGFLDMGMILSTMKVGAGLVTYVIQLVQRVYEVINDSGVQMLIFLAGLQSISPSIYEACQIEGATSWETFWKITFPMISPMILVNLIYTVIDSFTKQSNIVMTYISSVYTTTPHLATAMSWIYFLVVLLIVFVCWGLSRSFVFYQRRD